MSALRLFARHAGRALRQEAAAAEATGHPTKIILNFAVPARSLVEAKPVDMVIVPGAAGVFGVLKDHVPTISELQPGVLAVHDEDTVSKYFVSGGFAHIERDTANITAVEACPMDELDLDAAKKGLSEAQSALASAGDEQAKVSAEIAVSTYEAIIKSLEA
eukprot:GFYU01009351.1.p2 GENE.GFYU01009351.1~~GFYU01009351.1.p2  ORF type:complete len:161 (-),score=52.41 GFYU01009351.1:228-710(-)